jgi:hypothetical protein
LKRLQDENKRLRDTSMVRREVSGSILRNRFRAVCMNKLGKLWEIYNQYQLLAHHHNEILNKLKRERNKLVD